MNYFFIYFFYYNTLNKLNAQHIVDLSLEFKKKSEIALSGSVKKSTYY